MNDLEELFLPRRSVRKFNQEKISQEEINQIVIAGLSSASGRNRKPWRIIVLQDKEMI